MNNNNNKKSHLFGCFLWFFLRKKKKNKQQTTGCLMHLLCTSYTLTCTRTNGELQKNRHGNDKAQMVKRRGESHISVFNSHLAMKQRKDVLQEINSHRTYIHPNATMDNFFPFFSLSDRRCYSSDSFFLAVLKFLKSIWCFFNLYQNTRTSVAMDNSSH